MEKNKTLASAKSYALRLIKFRLRSERELAEKLERKSYPAETIDAVVFSLKKARLLDDALFAKLWAESRLKRSYGLARLAYELKQKGIDKDIIEETLKDLRQNYSEEETVLRVVRHKIEKMKNLAPEKIRARLYGFLLRRGYPSNIVIHVLLNEIGYEKTLHE